jgi:hypothetical protein
MSRGDVTGEVRIEVDGEAYTLAFTPNALCDLEDATGKTVVQIGRELDAMLADEDMSVTKLRLLLLHALSEHHDDMDLKGAGRLMHQMGVVEASGKVMEAFMIAFPDDEEDGEAAPAPGKGKAKAR